MPSWDVRLDVRCYMTVEVEADTEAEAHEAAIDHTEHLDDSMIYDVTVLDAVMMPSDAESPQEATGRDA